jgi:hypothetical protein
MAHDKAPENMAPPTAFAGARDLLTGQTILMPQEDHDAYYTFVRTYSAQFQPQTFDEQQMVRTMADTQWRLNRSRAIECNLLTYQVSQLNNVVPSNHTEPQTALTLARMAGMLTKELARMSLYERRLTDVLESTRKTLERVQHARRASHEASLRIAAAIREMRKRQQQAWKPADNGFQFSLDEIDKHLNHEKVVAQAKTFTARC